MSDRMGFLEDYVLRVSEDSVKTDLEVIHEVCGQHLCDAVSGDTLAVLVRTADVHEGECPGDPDGD